MTSKIHRDEVIHAQVEKCGFVLNHPLVFKEFISTLHVIEVDYDHEDLSPLCSLSSSFVNFRDTLLYSHNNLMMDDVSEALDCKENMK